MTSNNVGKVENSTGVEKSEDYYGCAKKILIAGLIFILVFSCFVVSSVINSISDISSILAVIFSLFSVLSIFINLYEKHPIFKKETDAFIICVGYGFFGALFGLTSYAKGTFFGWMLIDTLFLISLVLCFFFQAFVTVVSFLQNSKDKNKNKNLSYGVYLFFFMISAGIFALCLIVLAVFIYAV